MQNRRNFIEAGVVAAVTASFLWRAVQLDAWDRPLGSDWESYLRNVLAIGTDRWATYNGWRGPLHSWLTLGALPLCGTPLVASKALSVVATAATIPATWVLGRAVGIPGAMWGAVLFGLWPDLVVVAHFSTMYPLLMALFVSGAALASLQTMPGAVGSGVLFGLAGATDIRGLALAACFVVATLPVRRAALMRSAICAAVAAIVCAVLLARVPVRLAPLSEQIATQWLLRPIDDVLIANLRSLFDAGPHLWIAVLCAAVALLRDTRARLPLAAPILALLASIAIVPLQFRYFLPVAPLFALLAAGGVATVRAPWFVPGLVVLVLCGTRSVSDRSLVHLLQHPGPGSIELRAAGFAHIEEGVTDVERAQREQRLAQVVDCSTLDVADVLVYPTPLLRPPPETCARIARDGVLGNQPTLFLTDEPDAVSTAVWIERVVAPTQDRTSRTETRVGVYLQR